jgi:hypothetical protein
VNPLPLTIPAFAQYQQPMIPLRGLWNSSPREGDKTVNAEIDWGMFGATTCVQFQLAGNSPVAISQIAALYVDNSRCGADVAFIFPDSAFQVTIPAHTQGLVPVLSNALMFYANAPAAVPGDVTIFQACNSMPPPIPLTPSATQQKATASGVSLATNASTVMVAGPASGTVVSLSGSVILNSAGGVQVSLADGAGHQLWIQNYSAVAGQIPLNIQVNATLNQRFVNGLNLVVSGTTVTGGSVYMNAYYTSP